MKKISLLILSISIILLGSCTRKKEEVFIKFNEEKFTITKNDWFNPMDTITEYNGEINFNMNLQKYEEGTYDLKYTIYEKNNEENQKVYYKTLVVKGE